MIHRRRYMIKPNISKTASQNTIQKDTSGFLREVLNVTAISTENHLFCSFRERYSMIIYQQVTLLKTLTQGLLRSRKILTITHTSKHPLIQNTVFILKNVGPNQNYNLIYFSRMRLYKWQGTVRPSLPLLLLIVTRLSMCYVLLKYIFSSDWKS